MKVILLFLFLLSASAAIAQPSYSPETRAQRDCNWLRDSLHVAAGKLNKAFNIQLDYYRQMDKYAGNAAMQQQVTQKSYAAMKALIGDALYPQYYRREEQLLQNAARKYHGPHQPQ